MHWQGLDVRRNSTRVEGRSRLFVVVVFITVPMSLDCFKVGGLSWRACSNSWINQDVKHLTMVGGSGFSKRENKTSTIW